MADVAEQEALWGAEEWGGAIFGGDSATSVYAAPTGAAITMTSAVRIVATMSATVLEE